MAKRSRVVLLVRRLPFFITVFTPLVIACIVIAAITRLSSITNEFVIGTVIPAVYEDFDTNIKQDVYIKNEGNSPIYVRVSIIYNYLDQNGITLFESPIAGTNYITTLSSSNNWVSSSDGYFYYKNVLKPNDSTDILVDSIEDLTSDNSKMLNVNIVVQGIQAYPDSAVREAWDVNITNGVLSLGSQ